MKGSSDIKNDQRCISGLSIIDDKPVAVWISEGIIRKVEEISAAEITDSHTYVAPGLIDNQVNGYNGIDFCAPDLSLEQVRRTVRQMWQMGVTTFIPTLITMPLDILRHSLGVLADAMLQEDMGSSMPGIHLEGPYISNMPGYRGAHNPDWARSPDWTEFLTLQSAARGRITQITLAPELPGAIEFIKKCIAKNIIVAIGHHAAPADIIRQAVAAGASVSTHLGNGCANQIDRHDNILWPQMADDRLMATIIADGQHLTADELKVIYKVKGPDNLVIVSDVVAFGGMPPGEYAWNGNTLTVTKDGTVGFKGQRILAGATFPLKDGVANMMRDAGCSLAQAINLATLNSARLNRLNDRGVLSSGYRADIIKFRLEEQQVQVCETWVAGNPVFQTGK